MHSNFSSSRLVRLLGDRAPVAAPAAGMDFAERLSRWVNAFDAIGLQAAHQSIRAMRAAAAPPAAAARPDAGRSLATQFRQARAALAHAIAQDLPAAASDAGFAPYQQRHLELQRQMEQAVAALREQVRQRLGPVSATLRQLAALDAVFEHLVAPRERALLPTAVSMMGRRYEQLRSAHRQTLEAGEPDDPLQWRAPGGWLQVFAHEWRQVLLAELDLRLEPVAGLVEALADEAGGQA